MILYSLSSCLDDGSRQQIIQARKEPKNADPTAPVASQNERPSRSSSTRPGLSRVSSALAGRRVLAALGSIERCLSIQNE